MFRIILILILLCPAVASAKNLLLSKSRMVFDDRTRTGQLIVSNTGNKTEQYELVVVEKKMLEGGGFKEIKDKNKAYNPLNGMVRFSPRRFTLDPHKLQVIRFKWRKPKNLKPGEYRSHLRFAVVPEQDQKAGARDDGKINFKAKITYGMTIPIIVRHGQLDYKVDIKKMKFRNNKLYVDLARTGNRSSYGDILITFKDSSGKSHIVKDMRGTAIYVPTPLRKFEIPLDKIPKKKIRNGTLTFEYKLKDKEGGDIIARKEIRV